MTPEAAVSALSGVLEEKELDLIVITKIENVRYLTGFTGTSGFVVITRKEALFLTDPRYTQQAQRECPSWEVIELRGKRLSEWMGETFAPKRVGVEEWLNVGALKRMKEKLPYTSFEVVEKAVEPLRASKSKRELERIKRALQIAQEAFGEVLPLVKPGVSERDIALELEWLMRKKGAERASFSIIVASGWRSSLPHGVASEKRIEAGELVLFDFGCVWEGYCSDITRMVKLGRPSREEAQVHRAVVNAMEAAIELMERGERNCANIHKRAEEVIEKSGFKGLFGHGLGHGVGLEIHEAPSLSPLSEDTLRGGEVFTVEPGIYIPGRFGVRVEDMCLLTPNGVQVLTELSREIVEI